MRGFRLRAHSLVLVVLPLVQGCGTYEATEARDQRAGSDRPAASGGRTDSRSTMGATDKLIGTWVVAPEAIKERDSYKNATETQRKMMEETISKVKQELTFTHNKMKMDMEIGGNKRSHENDYTVKSVEGNRLVLTVKDQNGKTEDSTVEFDGDKLVLHGPTQESETLVFRRK